MEIMQGVVCTLPAHQEKTVAAEEEGFVAFAITESVGGAPKFAEVKQGFPHVVANRFRMEQRRTVNFRHNRLLHRSNTVGQLDSPKAWCVGCIRREKHKKLGVPPIGCV